MRNQEFEIQSYWQQEKGRWSDKENTYVDKILDPEEEKTLKVVYEPDNNIIKFIGGPTGFESYYFSDVANVVKNHPKHETFCICGGTLNRWPSCTIKMEDFRQIISQIKKRENQK